MNSGTKWTQQDDTELMRLTNLNKSDFYIARHLKRSIQGIKSRRHTISKGRASNHENIKMLRPYSLTAFIDTNDNESAFWCCSCSIPSTQSVENIILCDHCGVVWSHWECVGLNLSKIEMSTYYHICYECKSKLSQRTKWTVDTDSMLIESVNDGMKMDQIARKLVRSKDSIHARINALNPMRSKLSKYAQCFLTEQQINDLSVGDKCDCMDFQGRFLSVQIIKRKVLKVKVHFIGFSKKYDIWINVDEKEKFAKYDSISTLQSEKYKNIKIGDRCDALIENKWTRCKVIGYDERLNEIKSNQILVEDVMNKSNKRWFHPCSDMIGFPHAFTTKKRMKTESNLEIELKQKKRRLG